MNKVYTIFVLYLITYIGFEPVMSKVVERQKRDVGTVISVIAELGPPIYGIIREYLKKKKCGKKIDSGMVNNYYNNNMETSQSLKDDVSGKMTEAGNAIHMKASGYYCDSSFCEEMGPNAKGSLGICSKQYCVCENGIATLQTCGYWKVYDPMYNRCSMAKNAILCH